MATCILVPLLAGVERKDPPWPVQLRLWPARLGTMTPSIALPFSPGMHTFGP